MKNLAICLEACLVLTLGCAANGGEANDEPPGRGVPDLKVDPAGAAGSDGEDVTPDAPLDDELVEKIYHGTPGGFRSVVGMNIRSGCHASSDPACIHDTTCTGALASGKTLITAAHCVDTKYLTRYGDFYLADVMVTYQRGFSLYCLTRSGGNYNGACSRRESTDHRTLFLYINPDYEGGYGDPHVTGHDVAVFVDYWYGGWPTSVTNRGDWVRMAHERIPGPAFVREGDKFNVAGFGASMNDDRSEALLRYDPDLLRADWVGDAHFLNYASGVRVCKGDSGSPALNFVGSAAISAGILSNIDSQEICAPPNDRQRYAKMDVNVDWIRTIIEGIAGNACQKNLVSWVTQTFGYKAMECD